MSDFFGDGGWQRNDALFRDKLEQSHAAVKMIAARLEDQGIPAEVQELRVRDHYDNRAAYDDHGRDILVQRPSGRILAFDVKQLIACCRRWKRRCQGILDYPYPEVIVHNWHTWNRPGRGKPDAVIKTHYPSGVTFVMPLQTEKLWRKDYIWDSTRDVGGYVYKISKFDAKSFDWLVERIKCIG